jgi:hypothetical protein
MCGGGRETAHFRFRLIWLAAGKCASIPPVVRENPE